MANIEVSDAFLQKLHVSNSQVIIETDWLSSGDWIEMCVGIWRASSMVGEVFDSQGRTLAKETGLGSAAEGERWIYEAFDAIEAG